MTVLRAGPQPIIVTSEGFALDGTVIARFRHQSGATDRTRTTPDWAL
jgi:hypothetical protein